MKSKVIRILFASILMMNLSCTTDDLDNQDFNSSQKNNVSKTESSVNVTVTSKIIDTLKVSDTLKVGVSLRAAEPDGDPLNPKIK